MPLLVVEDLRVEQTSRRGRRQLVTDVALSVEPGEAVGLVGESGSGKSLTARACMRLLPPGIAAHGRIEFDGRSVLDMSRQELQAFRQREIAMIFQDPRAHINPVRTVGDFLTEALRLVRGMPRRSADRLVVGLLEEVGISEPDRRLRQFPHELSGGMLQRVMIAAALAAEPRMLIADEPTTALDVTTQSDVMAILGELRHERGLGLLFITHDLELATATCDRIAVMYAGRIVEQAPAELLDQRPQHPYTDGLLTSRPSIDRRMETLHAIPGRPVAAYEAPEGCAFAPRCRFAEDICRQIEPPRRVLGDGVVACHRSEEVAPQFATALQGSR